VANNNTSTQVGAAPLLLDLAFKPQLKCQHLLAGHNNNNAACYAQNGADAMSTCSQHKRKADRQLPNQV